MSLSGCYLIINSNIIPYLLIMVFKKLLIKYRLHRKKTNYRRLETTRRFICGGACPLTTWLLVNLGLAEVKLTGVYAVSISAWKTSLQLCQAVLLSAGFWNPGRFQNKMKRSRITWLLESRRLVFFGSVDSMRELVRFVCVRLLCWFLRGCAWPASLRWWSLYWK